MCMLQNNYKTLRTYKLTRTKQQFKCKMCKCNRNTLCCDLRTLCLFGIKPSNIKKYLLNNKWDRLLINYELIHKCALY